jgi:Tfp pilus assembly protein PilF
MSRTIRSTRSNRITETFESPSRGPLVLFAIGALAVATLIACDVKGDKRHTDSAVVTKPDESLQQSVASDSSSTTSSVPQNVSFASAESTYQQHRYKEAAQMFEVYVQRRPENPWGHYMLGLSSWKAGQLDEAVAAFEESIRLDSTHVKSYLNLGRVLLDQAKPKEALTRVTAAAEIDPTSSEVHRMLGRVRTSLEQPDSAMTEYRVALSFDENDVWSMNNLGLLLIQQERYDEALPPLARVVELRGSSPVFQNNLGIVLERTGHVSQAMEAYRAALAADTTYVKASRSVARLTGFVDDPSTSPVDLAELSRSFQRDIAAWKLERTTPVRATAVKPDSQPVPRR